MSTVLEWLLLFVVLYPVVTASLWIAGGVLFRLLEEGTGSADRIDGWPGVTVLVPAFNEASTIGACVRAVLASDYPDLELLVLDDGSTDATVAEAEAAAVGDLRCRVVHDPVNRGKAERLNLGLEQARHELVAVIDADTQVYPRALRHLVSAIEVSPVRAAVAGAPYVANRTGWLAALQVLEAAAVIGLIRRTQSLTGRVGVVAGVLGLFRRSRVLEVGGFDRRMATEDIELTWRLLMRGWHTVYQPRALVGMQVPTSIRGLWAQRKRWARGQGEALHTHLFTMLRLRNHRLWLIAAESLLSATWVVCLALSIVLAVMEVVRNGTAHLAALAFASGVAIAMVATLQVSAALLMRSRYDRIGWRSMLVAGAIYPFAFWLFSAAASLRQTIPALIRGPRDTPVTWDLPR